MFFKVWKELEGFRGTIIKMDTIFKYIIGERNFHQYHGIPTKACYCYIHVQLYDFLIKTINEVIFNLFMNNLKKHTTTIQLAIQYQFKSKDIRKWFNSLNIKNL